MRAALLALISLFVLATPAAAQVRDPFEPAIAPESATTTTTTGTTAGTGQPAAQPPPTTDTLANTGADIQGWAVVALGIMAVGAGALYVFRFYSQPLSK
ncbi:MAG: LPXTG cell wall anchor domain-containing protein [Actinomycetota bacterium]|nr:LPXTG cell wall anchor domain-containing protein [Actinomycetota bacterium]